MMIKLKGKGVDLCIIQAYAPTSTASDEEMRQFYEQMALAMKSCKPHDIQVVMGDFNAKVGNLKDKDRVTGNFGLGDRNERGEDFVNWCTQKSLVITDTLFQHQKRHLYTWKKPGDNTRNQIDFICINQRFRNTVQQCKTCPGADCNSDHSLLKTCLNCKLKKLKKAKTNPRLKFSLLTQHTPICTAFEIEVQNRFSQLSVEDNENEPTPEEDWENLQNILIETSEKLIPKKQKLQKQLWMSDEIIKLMNVRRTHKSRNLKTYTKKAKEKWINDQCVELEDLEKRDVQMMYNKIKKMSQRSCPTANTAMKGKDDETIFEKGDIQNRWIEYFNELFNDDDRADTDTDTTTNLTEDVNLSGPKILETEVKDALKKMKNGKATGNDKVCKEIW